MRIKKITGRLICTALLLCFGFSAKAQIFNDSIPISTDVWTINASYESPESARRGYRRFSYYRMAGVLIFEKATKIGPRQFEEICKDSSYKITSIRVLTDSTAIRKYSRDTSIKKVFVIE